MLKTKNFVGFAILLLSIALVAGCGGNEPQGEASEQADQSDGSDSENANNEEASEDHTRVIEHAMGETPIEGKPERIVALHMGAIDSLLAMGIQPVGAVKAWGADPWYDHWKEDLEGVSVLGAATQPNLEKIASLDPDLIIGTKVRQEKVYDKLSQIAPTVMTESIGKPWLENFKLFVEATGRQDKGEEVLQAWNDRLDDFKSKLGENDTEVSLLTFRPEQVRIYVTAFPGSIIAQAGLSHPAVQGENENEWGMINIKKEQIPLADGDKIFYWRRTDDQSDASASKQVMNEWMQHPLWKDLKAAQNDEVYQVDPVTWNLAGGMQAAHLLLDDLYQHFDIENNQ